MATEETKPVEREAFDRWAHKKGFGSLECFAIWDYVQAERQASADTALERAAGVAEGRLAFSIAVAIRALKGSR